MESALGRRRDGGLRLLSQLTAARSEAGSSGEAAQRVVGEYLSAAGYQVQYTVDDPVALAAHPDFTPPLPGEPPVNLVATPRTPSSHPRLGFLAHVDTERAGAGWTGEPWRAVCTDGRVYGLGVADDKSGLVAAAVAAAAIADTGGVAPVVLSVHAKGGGARGTLPVMMNAPALSAVVYVHPAETGRGLAEIKHATRGILDLIVTVTGWLGPYREIGTPESARASDCGDALAALMRVLDRVRQGPLVDCQVNVGRVVAGDRAGVVPVRAEAAIRAVFDAPHTGADLLRRVDTEIRRCASELSSQSGTLSAETTAVTFLANPGSTNWDSALCRVVRDAVQQTTGVSPEPYGAHLASDLRFPMRLRGIPAVGIGCRAGGFYGPDEWVDIEDLWQLTATVARVAQSWAAREER